jgi:hypothetical protein
MQLTQDQTPPQTPASRNQQENNLPPVLFDFMGPSPNMQQSSDVSATVPANTEPPPNPTLLPSWLPSAVAAYMPSTGNVAS